MALPLVVGLTSLLAAAVVGLIGESSRARGPSGNLAAIGIVAVTVGLVAGVI
jgi:hypothetical protein